MEDKLTAGERATIQGRAIIKAWPGWHLRELVAELEDVARTKGRNVDIADPLFFGDLLEALVDLEVNQAEFFRGVLQRWRRPEA